MGPMRNVIQEIVMAKRQPVVLVTGGSRGIGASVCRLAAEAGFDVAVNFRSEAAAAAAVVAACRAAGAQAAAFAGDMGVEDGVWVKFIEPPCRTGDRSGGRRG